jgi:predicted NACHT family NTPase
MDRGIQATAVGLEEAKNALKLKGWTQEYLAGVAGCTRQTVSKFLAGTRIEKRIFQDICSGLDLRWGEITELETNESIDQPLNIDELVETIRVNIYDSIQTKCGSMRVLDMTQPINLNEIYTTVNILEKITGRQRLEYQELMQSCSLENYDRFSLSGVQEARIPALDAINKYAKLMILGKPGAGKTTFLKYVALQCIEGGFKPHLIPLFITLKDFAEANNEPSLIDYIIQFFKSYGIEPDTKINNGLCKSFFDDSHTSIEFLLRQGRFAILLDGLDEVREVDSGGVLQQIQVFSDRFSNNLFLITCRIAAREYTFEKFTEVEVADFDDRQIATFTQQWFNSKKDPIKAENFIKKLQEEPGIRELASSPILLTLLCLVFGESGSFPSNRSELYKEGLDVLLKKWDAKRNIQRDRVYQKLSLKRKEDLLSQIALDTFEQGQYFFKQKEAERYITQYIRNLPDANMEEDALQLDSEAVLKSIEAQHGLFVERARGIYSFSHLTFHEYFTARKISTSTNSDILVKKLAAYVADKRWREIFLLTSGMLENADLLMEAMKQHIDSTFSQDNQLNNFLIWVAQKSCSTNNDNNYKPAAVRAYYFNIARDLARNLDLAVAIASDLDYAHALTIDLTLVQAHAVDPELDRVCSFNHTLDLILSQVLDLDLAEALDLDPTYALDPSQALDLAPAPAYALTPTVESIELYKLLQQMKNHLPDTSLENRTNFHQRMHFYRWWLKNGQAWIERLKAIEVDYRNIARNWQFSEAQKKLLQQYYDANKFLVECLNSDCYVSREVRESIESTFLLPISSIEKLKSKK